jgi:Calcineurin-like phosphoesterase
MEHDFEKEDRKIFREYCKAYKYTPLILPAKKRIIVIGDLHGDFELTIKVLKMSQLIDDDHHWIGGDTFVVQIGDQLDGCRPLDYKCDHPLSQNPHHSESMSQDSQPEDVKILKYFTLLNDEAIKQQGAVISLFGNHEIMNMMGNMNYVTFRDLKGFENYTDEKMVFKSGKEARIHAFKPGNEYGQLLACTRVPAIIIGSFLFIHAGIVPELTKKLNLSKPSDLYKISYFLRKWLLGLINKNNVVDIVNSSKYSLFWNRVLGNIPPNMSNNDPQCVKYLNETLKIFHVDKMIIGHTPQFFTNYQGINSTCGDKLWRVDFGGSFGFDKFDPYFVKNKNVVEFRKAQILEILNDQEIKIIKEKE